jgi:putative endonuclease
MVTVYVLAGDSGTRYVGITNNLERRLAEHRAHHSHSSHRLGQFILLLSEEFPDYPSARKREVFLKSGKGRMWLNERLAGPEPA